jgi:hypothetical protein
MSAKGIYYHFFRKKRALIIWAGILASGHAL